MSAVKQENDASLFSYSPPGKWKPDVPAPSNDGLLVGLNLVPKSNGFYGPEKAPAIAASQSTTPFGNALKAHGQFHSVTKVSGGVPRYYVGTFASASGDSRIVSQEEGGAWSDLSRGGGYTITAARPWTFANFGAKVFAGNRLHNLQVSQGGSGTFSDVTDAPDFVYIAEVNGFIVGVNLNDSHHGEGTQPYRVWWSSIGDGESWPDPTSDTAINTLSGFQDLFGGGELKAIVPGIGGSDAIILSERKMWRMNFAGPPAIFQFDEIETDQGTSIPGSIARFNETFFFYGQNGFYWFDGQNAHPIGQGHMDEFFFEDLSVSSVFGFQQAIVAGLDTLNKNYVVAYRNADAAGNNNNRILRYNWLSEEWSNSAQAIDVMGNMSSDGTSTDSTQLFVMGSDFQTASLTGATLEADIETSENFNPNGGRTRVKSVLPLIDAAIVNTRIKTRDALHLDHELSANRTWSNHGTMRYDDVKVTGRFYRCAINIPAGQVWTNFQGLQYETTPWGYGPVIPPA